MIGPIKGVSALAMVFTLTLSAVAEESADSQPSLETQIRQLREQLNALEGAMVTQQSAQADVETRQATLENKVIEAHPASLGRYFAGLGEAVTEGDCCGYKTGCGTGCGTDCGEGGCFDSCCDSGWMHRIDKDKWVKVGAGLRTSFRSREAASADGSHANDFNIDNARLYFSGQGHPLFGFELNTDINNAQGWDVPGSTVGGESFNAGEMRILDAVIKMKLTDSVNLWAGRFLPPSDRSNLSGPFYLNSWLFPYTQFGYNNIFQGRDDGAALWGQRGDGAFKWQFGVFDGENSGGPTAIGHPETDNLQFNGRVVLNLLDPEPG